MQRDTSDKHITDRIAVAFGFHRPDGGLVQHTKLNGLNRVYLGTKDRMAELSVYTLPPAIRKTVLCEADRFTGLLVQTTWNRTTNQVTRAVSAIDVGEWSNREKFGLGHLAQLRYPLLQQATEVPLRDPDAARARLIQAAWRVNQALEH